MDTHGISGCWFGTCFIFPYISNNHPNWLSYFSGGLKPLTRFCWRKIWIFWVKMRIWSVKIVALSTDCFDGNFDRTPWIRGSYHEFFHEDDDQHQDFSAYEIYEHVVGASKTFFFAILELFFSVISDDWEILGAPVMISLWMAYEWPETTKDGRRFKRSIQLLMLVGGLEHEFIWFLSSQPTNSYFSEGLVETTNQLMLMQPLANSFVRVIVVGGLCIGQGKWWSRRKFAETDWNSNF